MKKPKLLYSLSIYWMSLVGLVRESILISILTPAQLGVWRLILTIQMYSKYLALNSSTLIVYRGQVKNVINSYIKRVNCIISFLSLSLCIIFSTVLSNILPIEGNYFYIWFALFSLSAFNIATNYFTSINLALKNFTKLAIFQFISPICMLVLIFIIRPHDDLTIVSLVVLSCAIPTLVFIKDFLSVVKYHKATYAYLKIKVRSLLVIIKSSMGNLFAPLSFTMFHTSEVWMMQSKFDIALVGYFSIILVFTNVSNLSASVFSTFMFAKDPLKTKSDTGFLCKKLIQVFSLVSVSVLIGNELILNLIPNYYPNYAEMVPYLAIYSFCIPFLSLRNVSLTSAISQNIGFLVGMFTVTLLIFKVVFSQFFIEEKESFFLSITIFNIIYGILVSIFPFFVKGR